MSRRLCYVLQASDKTSVGIWSKYLATKDLQGGLIKKVRNDDVAVGIRSAVVG